MKKINRVDQSKILEISKKYLEIHQNISIVEKKMQDLQNLSSKLISELEDCRKEEKNLMGDMEKTYGTGKLNPLSFCWEK
jgi:hypothetical protein